VVGGELCRNFDGFEEESRVTGCRGTGNELCGDVPVRLVFRRNDLASLFSSVEEAFSYLAIHRLFPAGSRHLEEGVEGVGRGDIR
jgi:hypothetical protein